MNAKESDEFIRFSFDPSVGSSTLRSMINAAAKENKNGKLNVIDNYNYQENNMDDQNF